MTGTAGSMRERLIAAAARLFATQGYKATSVADIQTACGLTAGSGALYKHFTSKKALLREVVHTHIAVMRESRAVFRIAEHDDPRETLRLLVDRAWHEMEQDREVLRVMLRDLEEFPDLLDEVWREVRTNINDAFTGWLREQHDRGVVQVGDPAATAAVLLASLTHVPIMRALIGKTPGDVRPEAFAAAWVDHALATLGLGAPPAPA